jgi:hypothetical protein
MTNTEDTGMALAKRLSAAALLSLWISTAVACDDYDEEMALAAAMTVTKLTQTAASQQGSSAQAAPSATRQSESADITAVEPTAQQTQTTQNSTGTVRR